MRIAWPNDNLSDPVSFSSEGPYWIFDLDGVLIEITATRFELLKRGKHKEFNRAGTYAEPILEMVTLANRLNDLGQRIVVMTGRDGYFLQDTAEQLSGIGLNYSLLWMREAGSTFPSFVEKRRFQEVYMRQTFSKLFPVGAIDDDPQVIRMWRELNIPSLLFSSLVTEKGLTL